MGIIYTASPINISASHLVDDSPEVLVEQARLQTAGIFTNAGINTYDEARRVVNSAKKYLDQWNEVDKSSHPMVKRMQDEVDHFLMLLETQDSYEKLGRSFAYSAELSHSLQRYATRGNAEELRMFSTNAMDKYLDQVINGDLYDIDNDADINFNVLVM